MMKICVVQTDGMTQSFAKYLSGDKDLTASPVTVKQYNYKSKDVDVTGHIIECGKVRQSSQRHLVMISQGTYGFLRHF